jgi:hypothetical protein
VSRLGALALDTATRSVQPAAATAASAARYSCVLIDTLHVEGVVPSHESYSTSGRIR